jgi:NADH:ubiquinone oxidoreductase subunit 6 (subunit J)
MFSRLLADDWSTLTGVATAIDGMIEKILGPVLIVIGVMAVCYAIYLGVMYAKAEDANKRKEVQGRLIGALIGAVIIIAGVTVCYAVDWVSVFETFSDVTLDKETTTGTGTISSLVRLMVR